MDYIPPPNGDLEDPDRPWVDANPATGTEGSRIIAKFFNVLQAEIINALIAMGIVPADGENNQLAQALQKGRAMDIAFMAGVSSDGSGQDLDVQEYGRLILSRAIRIEDIYAHAAVAPTGAAVILDIEKNGATIFGTKPRINAGDNTHTAGTFAGGAEYIDAAAGDVLVFKITQVGSTIAGQKLTATLRASGI